MTSRSATSPAPVGTDPHGPPIPGLLVRRANQVMNAVWARRVGSVLTSPQYAVLASVYRAPAVDQVTIGRLASLDRSTLADVLDRLASRGLLVRVRDEADGRRNLVSLTKKGRKLVESLAPLVAEVDRELVECFEEAERDEFLRQFVRLVKHGEARTSEPSA